MVLMEVGSSRWAHDTPAASPCLESDDGASHAPHDPLPAALAPLTYRAPYNPRVLELERLRDELYMERSRLDELLQRTERTLTDLRHSRYDMAGYTVPPYASSVRMHSSPPTAALDDRRGPGHPSPALRASDAPDLARRAASWHLRERLA